MSSKEYTSMAGKPSRVEEIVIAEREAHIVNHYVNHLEKRDWREIMEERWEGHSESLFDAALNIVYQRKDKKLIRDINHHLPSITQTSQQYFK